MTITRSETIAELAKALARAQAEFPAIPKTEDNPFFKKKYAGLASVVEVASPIVAKHGLSVTQLIGFSEGLDTLTTILMHESGEWIEATMRMHLGKNDAQAQGSATTYARRYSYMAALGLVADDDDDGNKATQQRPAQAAPNAGNFAAKRSAPQAAPANGNLATEKQIKLLQIRLRETFPDDQDERRAFVNDVVGRVVESSKELTKAECSKAIDALKPQDEPLPEEAPFEFGGGE